ncbi:MAG: hypothetical protein WBM84_05945, partial [Sedimenticolaceae bacterium]
GCRRCMRATTRGVDLNALRSLLGFLVLTTGVAIAVDRAREGQFDRGPGGEPARCQSTLYATGIDSDR